MNVRILQKRPEVSSLYEISSSPVFIAHCPEIQAQPIIHKLCRMIEILDDGQLNIRKNGTH